MKYILGISAYFHDSAAALIFEGRVIAAAQEERFSRIKHDANFPTNAVNYCLQEGNITIDDVDEIVFYEKPFQKFERLIDAHIRNIPFGFSAFKKSMHTWFSHKLWIPRDIQKALTTKKSISFAEHHESHAAAAYFTSPFDDAAILVVDAVGEKSCTSISIGEGAKIQPVAQQNYPHSIGLFYSAFTYYCGFKVNSGEYKLMGLAPYGKPIYVDLIKQAFISWNDLGEVKLNMKAYDFDAGLKMLSKKGVRTLQNPVRKPETSINQFYKDIAASVQLILEELMIDLVRYTLKMTEKKNLVMSGGVALNCKVNQVLVETFDSTHFWFQPAAGDAGGALGAGLAYYYKNQSDRFVIPNTLTDQIYLGPSYNATETEQILNHFSANYQKFGDAELLSLIAEQLSSDRIIGWFQGRMEFGPRALGHRSILASPISENMQSRLNLAIKKREGFRPFAPVVLNDHASHWFDHINEAKYMMCTSSSTRKKEIPACVHLDNTARVQTLNSNDNPKLYQLISNFYEKTGVPMLVNTSLNLRGEPIVCSPEDAINCFIQTEIDLLVLNNFVLFKEQNQHLKTSKDVIQILD